MIEDNGQTIWVPIIHGKRDYFLANHKRLQMFRRIKQYLHLTRRQFFALGGTTQHIINKDLRAAYFNRINEQSQCQ
jgi:hypothetical protein